MKMCLAKSSSLSSPCNFPCLMFCSIPVRVNKRINCRGTMNCIQQFLNEIIVATSERPHACFRFDEWLIMEIPSLSMRMIYYRKKKTRLNSPKSEQLRNMQEMVRTWSMLMWDYPYWHDGSHQVISDAIIASFTPFGQWKITCNLIIDSGSCEKHSGESCSG